MDAYLDAQARATGQVLAARRQDDTIYGDELAASEILVEYQVLWTSPNDRFLQVGHNEWGTSNSDQIDRRKRRLTDHLRWCMDHLKQEMSTTQVDAYLQSGPLADLLNNPVWRAPNFGAEGGHLSSTDLLAHIEQSTVRADDSGRSTST